MQLDLETYKRHAGRVELDGIDFDAVRAEPLDDDSLRCLRYMHDVEHHTVCYLRDLLVTPAHRDPDMTTFLTMWTFEEFCELHDAVDLAVGAHLQDGQLSGADARHLGCPLSFERRRRLLAEGGKGGHEGGYNHETS